MQAAATRRAGYITHDAAGAAEPGHHFSALFVLAGSKGVDSGELRRRLGLSDDDFRGLLDELQRGYLVDVVSGRRGELMVENLRLTDEGEATLQGILEKMCELPELE